MYRLGILQGREVKRLGAIQKTIFNYTRKNGRTAKFPKSRFIQGAYPILSGRKALRGRLLEGKHFYTTNKKVPEIFRANDI